MPPPVYSLAFSPDGKILAAGIGTLGNTTEGPPWGGTGAVRLWEVPSGKLLRLFNDQFSSMPNAVDFSPDGSTVIAGSQRYIRNTGGNPGDGSWVRFWDIATGQEQAPLKMKESGGFIVQLLYLPEKDRMIVGRSGAPSILFDLKKQEEVHRFEQSSQWCASADGKILVGSGSPKVNLYDAATGKVLQSWKPKNGLPKCVQFSRDGQRIAVACDSGDVYLLNPELDKELSSLKVGVGVRSVVFSADGKLLAVAEREAVHFFDVPSGKLLRSIDKQVDGINAIALSPDAKTLAIGTGREQNSTERATKGATRLWEVETAKLLATLE